MARFFRTIPPPNLSPGKDYTGYRAGVREDFECCCAYCLRHEEWGGGAEHYELDHFKPKKLFPELVNDFNNIYYCCHRCNKRKHCSWPSERELNSGAAFVDLCQDNFNNHYLVLENGKLEFLTRAAEYTAKKLRLNSDEMIKQRANILRDSLKIDEPRWRPS